MMNYGVKSWKNQDGLVKKFFFILRIGKSYFSCLFLLLFGRKQGLITMTCPTTPD